MLVPFMEGFLGAGQCSEERILIVPDKFPKVSDALANATDGDTILIKSSLTPYTEDMIQVNKSVKIIGENPETTVFDGENTANVIFLVTSDNVIIKNLTIINLSRQYGSAIRINNALNVKVENVRIEEACFGIEVKSSNFTEVVFNEIIKCSFGIYIHDNSYNNTITGNTFKDNNIALQIDSSKFNRIYHNNFMNSTSEHVKLFDAPQTFDDGYPSGGNYWDDMTGIDMKNGPKQDMDGSDGIIDESYKDWDRYPMVHPLKKFKISIDFYDYFIKVFTNSTLITVSLNKTNKSLDILFNKSEGIGGCRVIISKELLSCKDSENWIITYDDGKNQFISKWISQDNKNSYFYIVYNGTLVNIIQIKGEMIIDEYPFFWNIALLLLLLTLMEVAVEKIVKQEKRGII